MGENNDIYRLGRSLERNKSISDRKEKGVFYTPGEIVELVVEELLGEVNPADNPYIKILDPACGAGYFLVKTHSKLKELFLKSFDELLEKNPCLKDKLTRENVGSFIAENNIWGADIDPEAAELTRSQLKQMAGGECETKIFCCDSLIDGADELAGLLGANEDKADIWENRYDYIVGNPPYVGHKGLAAVYKKQLQLVYEGIYRDKSDLYYCFIKRGIDLLKDGGRLSFIVSRYFMEGPSAAGLRKYIDENCTVIAVVDFFGKQVFADAGVDVCILTLEKGRRKADTRVVRYGSAGGNTRKAIDTAGQPEYFSVGKEQLRNEGWMLLPPYKHEIFLTVEKAGTHSVGDLFDSYQGIITGCDRAFVVDEDAIERFGIERSLLRPWIKNSDVSKYHVKPFKYHIIYSDSIGSVAEYPNALRHIEQYRERLLGRRECKKGVRKWYQLQWGRKSEPFESRKLVYPYKSDSNRFALDERGYYCSADVYSLILKPGFSSSITYEYLSAVLNSRLFEFYFKCYAKKISDRLYDYYPNTVLRIRLNLNVISEKIDSNSKLLHSSAGMEEKRLAADTIDRELYRIYGLSDKQIEIIEKETCGACI